MPPDGGGERKKKGTPHRRSLRGYYGLCERAHCVCREAQNRRTVGDPNVGQRVPIFVSLPSCAPDTVISYLLPVHM